MSENKTINTLLNADLLPSVDNAIKNLTDEPTSKAGKTFGDIWDLVFGYISFVAEKRRIKYKQALSLYEQELSEAISKIPDDKRIEPSVQITAQALENSKYCIEDEELRQMFTSLICNSMNSDYSEFVHPSFAEIIKQMSVLDAKVINLFKNKSGSYVRLPVCKYSLYLLNSPSYIDVPDHIFLELPNADFRLCSQSLSSLSRLGLLEISYSQKLDTPNLYDKFLHHQAYEFAKNNFSFANIKLIEGVVAATPLGRSFIDICIPD